MLVALFVAAKQLSIDN